MSPRRNRIPRTSRRTFLRILSVGYSRKMKGLSIVRPCGLEKTKKTWKLERRAGLGPSPPRWTQIRVCSLKVFVDAKQNVRLMLVWAEKFDSSCRNLNDSPPHGTRIILEGLERCRVAKWKFFEFALLKVMEFSKLSALKEWWTRESFTRLKIPALTSWNSPSKRAKIPRQSIEIHFQASPPSTS